MAFAYPCVDRLVAKKSCKRPCEAEDVVALVARASELSGNRKPLRFAEGSFTYDQQLSRAPHAASLKRTASGQAPAAA
jgi:hypothetical protein